jgi:hypothetical protein
MRTQTRELVFGAHKMTIVCRAAPSEAADQEATPNTDDWVVDGDDSSGLDIWPAATALCEYLLRCQLQLVVRSPNPSQEYSVVCDNMVL